MALLDTHLYPYFNEDWEGEMVWTLDDEKIPPRIREHGQSLSPPASYVICLGFGQYLLYSEQAELLDLVFLKDVAQ